jgi:hypothetical protein
MGRICDPAVRKRVGSEKVAEFIIPPRFRNTQDWNQRTAENYDQQSNADDGDFLSAGKIPE